jgi:probable addiction module antidote protein
MTEQRLSTDDPATALDSLDAVAGFLAHAFESGDAGDIATALGVVARSTGMAELAAAAGMTRDQLKDSLLAGELGFDATLAIMKVIDRHVPAG